MYDYYLTREEEKQLEKYQNKVIDRINDSVYNVLELNPMGIQKSFYGKAKIICTATHYYLLSYSTIVCGYNRLNNTFIRYWGDWSVTSSKHVNAFIRNIGGHTLNKKEWLALMLYKEYTFNELYI